MNQDRLLHLVAEKVTEISGKDYVVDYLPQRNISEQTSKIFRCITPGSMTLEANYRTRYPLIHQDITVSLFAVPSPENLTESIIKYQDELTLILKEMMSRGNPVIIDDGRGERATIISGECKPVQDSGIALAGLFDDPPIIMGAVTLTCLLG